METGDRETGVRETGDRSELAILSSSFVVDTPLPPDTPLAACCDTENTADVDQMHGWVRDLTQEGVEPNPGPTGGDGHKRAAPAADEPSSSKKAHTLISHGAGGSAGGGGGGGSAGGGGDQHPMEVVPSIAAAAQGVSHAKEDVEKAEVKVKEAETKVEKAEVKVEKAEAKETEAKKELEKAKAGNDQDLIKFAISSLTTAQEGVKTAQEGVKTAQEGVKTAQEGVKTAQRLLGIATDNLEFTQKRANDLQGAPDLSFPVVPMYLTAFLGFRIANVTAYSTLIEFLSHVCLSFISLLYCRNVTT
jgi:hypothetical protein